MSKWANSQPWKKQAIDSFSVSDLSHLLTVALLSWETWAIHSHCSLKKRRWANCSGFLNLQKNVQKIWFYSIFLVNHLFLWVKERLSDLLKKTKRFAHLLFYHEQPEQITHSRYFVLSNLSDFLTVSYLSWATWAISSQLLICPERSEQIAQSHSLQWAILSKWAMSEWANKQIPNPGIQ